MIITVDGPVASGKSTVAARVAQKLGFSFVSTGAMFRSLAWGMIQEGIDRRDERAVESFCASHTIEMKKVGNTNHFFCDGKEATAFLSLLEVAQGSSIISTYSFVRNKLADLQRQIGKTKDSVFEGRDMGSVIFPDAFLKIYLEASFTVRAHRRFLELSDQAGGSPLPEEELAEEIQKRDVRDKQRKLSPLKPALDAIIIDTTNLSIDQVVDQIVVLFREKYALQNR